MKIHFIESLIHQWVFMWYWWIRLTTSYLYLVKTTSLYSTYCKFPFNLQQFRVHFSRAATTYMFSGPLTIVLKQTWNLGQFAAFNLFSNQMFRCFCYKTFAFPFISRLFCLRKVIYLITFQFPSWFNGERVWHSIWGS